MRYTYRDLEKEPLAVAEVLELAARGGFPAAGMVNTKSQLFKKVQPDLEHMGAEEIAQLIHDYPRIMVRPLLSEGTSLLVGFEAARYKEYLGLA
ncbi:hypothetical protein hamaS1_21240 [Moorella sp. Hama-1]|nr:ArsC/Spx/MgsR family protein [Moorella sp. Hama-1]BCV22055.1 hypothetical protein hamaS1_21240 [Moorella sp. Hama-1]